MGSANCTISIPGFGAIRVKATRVTHGMSVIQYNVGGEGRNVGAFYASKRTSGSFELDLVFGTYWGYERVMLWLQSYMYWAGNPKTFATPVRVTIPSRNFDKTGALEAGVSFGDKVGEVTYKATLEFVGARDPLEMAGTYVSQYALPDNSDPSLPYFNPSGDELKGQQNGWDTAYDYLPDPATPDDSPVSLPEVELPDWF